MNQIKNIDADVINKCRENNSFFIKHGAYGSVQQKIYGDKEIAVKYFYKKDEFKINMTEVEHLRACAHDNIVKLLGAGPNIAESELHYYVMEFAPNGSLDDLLHKQLDVKYTLEQALTWIYQCCRAIQYMHQDFNPPYLHRDIKPSNLLLFNYGRKVKLCDFGTVKKVLNTKNTVERGTYLYMAPEVMQSFQGTNAHYDTRCDVYSIGVVFWELLTRERPYVHITNAMGVLFHVAMNKGSLSDIPGCPDLLEALIKSCWKHEFKERPGINTIIKVLKWFLVCILNQSENPVPNQPQFPSLVSSSNIQNSASSSTNSSSISSSLEIIHSSESWTGCCNNNPDKQWPEYKLEPLDCKSYSIMQSGADATGNTNMSQENDAEFDADSLDGDRVVSPETGINKNSEANNDDTYQNNLPFIDQTLLPKDPLPNNEESNMIHQQHMVLLKRYVHLFAECQKIGIANNELLNELVPQEDIERRKLIERYCTLKYKEEEDKIRVNQ